MGDEIRTPYQLRLLKARHEAVRHQSRDHLLRTIKELRAQVEGGKD
jgi:hypothetical protein